MPYAAHWIGIAIAAVLVAVAVVVTIIRKKRPRRLPVMVLPSNTEKEKTTSIPLAPVDHQSHDKFDNSPEEFKPVLFERHRPPGDDSIHK